MYPGFCRASRKMFSIITAAGLKRGRCAGDRRPVKMVAMQGVVP